jgi:hypothetical protein
MAMNSVSQPQAEPPKPKKNQWCRKSFWTRPQLLGKGGLILVFPFNFQVPHENVKVNLQGAATVISLAKNVSKRASLLYRTFFLR